MGLPLRNRSEKPRLSRCPPPFFSIILYREILFKTTTKPVDVRVRKVVELIKRLIGNVPMSEEKREIILQAATRAFAQKGFAAVGIREVAREAGLNSATLYHYFENKEGIYAAVLERTFDQLVEILHEISQLDTGPEPVLRFAIDRYVDFIRDNRDIVKILVHEFNLETDIVSDVATKFYNTFFKIAEEMLAARRADKGTRQIEPKHLLISGIGLCVIYFIIAPLFDLLEGKDQLSPDMLADWKKAVSDLMLYGIMER
jgi:TetR/AcrR family transcriptional regulator